MSFPATDANPNSSPSPSFSDSVFLFTRADRLTRSVPLMPAIAELASRTTDPATGERLARVRVMTVEIESTSSLLAGDSVASTSSPEIESTSSPNPDAVAARLCGGALTDVPPTLARETRVGLALARHRGSAATTLLPLPCVLGDDNVDAFLTGTHEGFLHTYGDFRHVSGRDVETRETFPSSGGGGGGGGAVRGASRGFDGDRARFVATRAATALGLLDGADWGGAAAAAAGGVSETVPGAVVATDDAETGSGTNDAETGSGTNDAETGSGTNDAETGSGTSDATPNHTVVSIYPPRGVSRANDGGAFAAERDGRCAFGSLPEESAAEARAARPRARQACACDDCRVSVTRPEVTAHQREKVRRDAGEKAHAALAELATKLIRGGRGVDGGGVDGEQGVGGRGVDGRDVDSLGSAPATAPALSEVQWMLLAAEAETVTLAAIAGFRDAWRNAPRETRSVSALAAARAAVDAACASAPENATTAPEKATTAPEKATTAPEKATAAPEKATTAPASTVNRVEALDGPVIRCACRCADASAECAHAGSEHSTLRTVREGRATRIGKPTYKLPDACWGCHRTFPETGDGGYGAFCGVSCFDNATRHHRADAIRETEEERVAVGVLVEMERKRRRTSPWTPPG